MTEPTTRPTGKEITAAVIVTMVGLALTWLYGPLYKSVKENTETAHMAITLGKVNESEIRNLKEDVKVLNRKAYE